MIKPLEVQVEGNIENALKKLKKKMAYEGIFRDLKRRRYYEKPSEKKKRKREESQRRLIKKRRRMEAKSNRRNFGRRN